MSNAGASSPKSPGRKNLIFLPLVLLVGLGAGVALENWRAQSGGGATSKAETLYTCPMHPQIIRHEPGECPICGMNLVPVKTESASAPPGERKIAFYRSPMDPKQTSPGPRQDEMGMDYLPVYEDELSGGGPAPPGLATVTIDPARQQVIGLTTTKVTLGPISGNWRTVASVAVDERRVRAINVKAQGYVEEIFVNFTGQPVAAGQALFSMFSPDLLAAENEYLLALRAHDTLSESPFTSDNGDDLVRSARKRLELWDVSESELKRIARSGRAEKALTILSPIAGVVTAKRVVQGSSLNPGDTPYEITDLSTVWALADAYESDLARARPGLPATLTLPAYPDRRFEGVVEFIDPTLNPATRAAKVRMSFANPAGELKPGLYGEVELLGEPRSGLLVPADAVISSGTRDVVFVALGAGKFQPREVQLGARSGDRVEVKSGLSEGEEVVTRANFLVDSESSLRASLAAIKGD